MRTRLLLLTMLAALGTGCASASFSYAEARDGFDSVTGYTAGPDEPLRFEFASTGRRWAWGMRVIRGTGLDWGIAHLFGVRPRAVPIENPSEFARDNLATMRIYGDGSLGQLADTGMRALWIVDNDPQPLDQIVAVSCIERVLEVLDVDPLAIAPPSRGGDAEARAIEADLKTLDQLAPWSRGAGQLTVLERELAGGAVHRATAVAHSSASIGRRLLRYLLRAARDESDAQLRDRFERGLIDMLANECSWALMLRVQATRFDDVRSAALLALVRRSGPVAVNWAVATLARFELSPAMRRQLVRLCATLPPELADRTFGRGPSPIGFLYDEVKKRDLARLKTNERSFWTDEDDGVSALALEALALSLSRDIDHDSAWADAWWNERALKGDRQ